MKEPPLPVDEADRLAALESLGVLYSPAEDRFDKITKLAQRTFDVPIALISLVSSHCQWFKSAQGVEIGEIPRAISFCGHAILGDDTFVINDASMDPRFANNPMVNGEPFIRFYAGQPIRSPSGKKLGTLCIVDTKPRDITPAEIEDLRSLAAWVENELKVSALSEEQTNLLNKIGQLKRKVLLDTLTRTWNRRGFEAIFPQEIERARRNNAPIAFFLFDVDEFKEINDNFGHRAGDAALMEVAQRIRASVRPYDIIARYGGDEFAVLLVDCDKEEAFRVAQRTLTKAAMRSIATPKGKIRITLSIGGVCADGTTSPDLYNLFEMADAALYEVKSKGRNHVEILDQAISSVTGFARNAVSQYYPPTPN